MKDNRKTGEEATVMVSSPALDKLPEITRHIERSLAGQLSNANRASVLIAVDEIYSNICKYSHATKVECICLVKEGTIRLQFLDNGTPYNPLDKADPDIDAELEDRNIGGLGIYLVKQQMDTVCYEYINGKNCLTITKKF